MTGTRILIAMCLLVAMAMGGAAEQPVDPQRPVYHFVPPANWMNDTMGIYWQGEYHIFYLYNPDGPVWRQAKQWGHAYSTDLLHWKYLPAALGPMPGGPENLCCQTGSLTDFNGVPTALYTCAPGVCLATSEDKLRTWKRYEKNPVIAGPPPGMDVTGFRDPYVFHRPDGWYLLVGSGTRLEGGTALLYSSHDLRKWDLLHPILSGKGKRDEVWEVPQLFRLGDQDIMLYSPTKESKFTRYFAGTFQNQQFVPKSVGKMDSGGYFYAATVFDDAQPHPIVIAWIKEGRSKDAVLKAGWSGTLSIPRRLSACGNGGICTAVATEVDHLRFAHKHYAGLSLASGVIRPLDVRGTALDIVAEFDPGTATRFGIKVRCSPNGEEETSIYFDRQLSRFVIDTTRSSQSKDVDKAILGDEFVWTAGKRVRLRILVDHSVVEAFAENRIAITGRVYPELPASVGVAPFAEGGAAKLRSLDVWQMKAVW